MSLFKNLKFHAWDPMGTTASLIEKWKPKNCRTEKDYEKSLAKFLRKDLEDIQVLHQSGSGRIRADIEVGGKVMIELKNDLNSTAKLQRLKGQIEDYLKTDKFIIVVIVGKVDAELKRDLSKFIESRFVTPFLENQIDLYFK